MIDIVYIAGGIINVCCNTQNTLSCAISSGRVFYRYNDSDL